MAILSPSDLETASYGTQGWNAIYSSNFQKINDYLWKKVSWQNPILDRDFSTPPGSPAKNDRYIVKAAGTGTWSGKDKQIAHYNGTTWDFTVPTEGFFVYAMDENVILVYDGTNWVLAATLIDHGNLLGLGDDDHSQYALLAGRASGQSLKGGIAASENLTLQSTNHATKGKILLGTSAYDESQNRLGIGTATPSESLDVFGNAKVSGELKHTGNKIGLFNATPALQQGPYTITNSTTTRSLDVSTATLTDVANVLGTLIDDLKNYGLLS